MAPMGRSRVVIGRSLRGNRVDVTVVPEITGLESVRRVRLTALPPGWILGSAQRGQNVQNVKGNLL